MAGTALMNIPKVDVFGIGISVTNYKEARDAIISAAAQRKSFALTALAVHGLIEAASDPELGRLVNDIDIVTPDGQPVRWAMNLLHGTGLNDRVYGPDLTNLVCESAAKDGIKVYLFGSTVVTCREFAAELLRRFPAIDIVGIQPDRFREATQVEDEEDIDRINASGAGLVLVGRGCPRQERWVAEHRGRVNAAMLAVGAAFDYIAGNLRQPPAWLQKAGLQWLFRLVQEPRRLWRRYLNTNTRFIWLLLLEFMRQRKSNPTNYRKT